MVRWLAAISIATVVAACGDAGERHALEQVQSQIEVTKQIDPLSADADSTEVVQIALDMFLEQFPDQEKYRLRVVRFHEDSSGFTVDLIPPSDLRPPIAGGGGVVRVNRNGLVEIMRVNQ